MTMVNSGLKGLTLQTLSTTIIVLKRFIDPLNHCYWERNVCFNIGIFNLLVSNKTNMNNFLPPEVVGRDNETQSQMSEHLSRIT